MNNNHSITNQNKVSNQKDKMNILTKIINTIKIKQTVFVFLFSLFSLVGFILSSQVTFAAPPTSPYAMGETLNPACAPGSTNCSVVPALTASGTPLSGFVPYYNASSTLTTGALIETGNSAGVNATSSTVTFYVQGTGSLNPFTVASSSGQSLFSVNPTGAILYNNQAGTSGQILQSNGLNSPPTWISTSTFASGLGSFVQGGNSFGATANLGTTDNNAFNLVTNSSTRLTILANGNVGVNTTTPAANFAVNGTSLFNNTVTIGTVPFAVGPSYSTNVGGEIRMVDNGSAVSLFGCNHTDPTLRCYASDIPTDVSNRFTINGNGKMTWGPGTAGSDLALFRNATSSLQTDGAFALANSLTMNGTTPVIFTPSANSALTIKSDNQEQLNLSRTTGTGFLNLGINPNGISQISAYRSDSPFVANLTINPDGGNVGIGTTTPLRTLTIQGNFGIGNSATAAGVGLNTNGTVGEILGVNNAGTAFNALQFTTGVSPSMYIGTNGNVGIGSTSPTTKLAIQGTAGANDLLDISSSSGTSILHIAASGNIGIGTTNPTSALSVVGNISVTDATTTRTNLGLSYLGNSSQSNYYNYAAWGDSLTGGNEDGTGVTYPNVLSTLTGQSVYNGGVGGQTSSQIGVREGGVSTTATISGGQIPASGGVTVTFPTGYEPVTSQGPAVGTAGNINGVHGVVALSGGIYTFTRSATGTAVSVSSAQFVVDQPYRGNFTIIWAGRNDSNATATVENNIASMVSSLPSPKRFLVMSVLNGSGESTGTSNYNNIISINNYLAATYPNNYLDVRSYLVSLYNSSNATDTQDHLNDIPPTSLRTDTLHLNAAGYSAVANYIYAWLQTYDTGIGAHPLNISDVKALFAAPPTIGSVLPSIGTFSSLQVTAGLNVTGSIVGSGSVYLGNNAGATTTKLYLAGGDLSHYIYSSGSSGNSMYFGEYSGNFHFYDTSPGGLRDMMTITNAKVGIGSTTPSQALTVVGNIYATGNVTCGGTCGSASQWTTSGSNIYYNTGNVGIGQVSPNNALSVNGAIDIGNNAGTATSSKLYLAAGDTAHYIYSSGSGGNSMYFGEYTGNFHFYDTSGAGHDVMTITGNNVGVNNTSPAALLDVRGSTGISSFTGTSTLGILSEAIVGNGSYAGIDFGLNTSVPIGRIALTKTNSGSFLNFGTSANFNNGITNTAMTINPSGFVGIGTTTPTAALEINGQVHIGSLFNTAVSSQGIVLGKDVAAASQGIEFIAANSGLGYGSKIYAVDPGTGNVDLRIATRASASSFTDRLTVRSDGNVGIGTTTPNLGPLTMGSGAYVSAGGVWTNASDRNLKENFASVSPTTILQGINSLAVTEWNYKNEDSSIKHIGPVAQDFYSIFHVGNSDKSISTIDPSGIALLGIQALDQKITALQGSLTGNATATNLSVYNPSNFSGDSVGEAKILAGSTSVRINFSQSYQYQPIITAFPEGYYVPGFISQKDNTGFTLAIPNATTTDIIFDWHSFASPQAQLTVSNGSTTPIVLIQSVANTPAPQTVLPIINTPVGDGSTSSTPPTDSSTTPVTATPTPTTNATPSPTPPPSVTPTPSATPSPTPTATATPTPAPTDTPAPTPSQTVTPPTPTDTPSN